MTKFVKFGVMQRATKCCKCKGFIIFDKDGVENESIGGLNRQYVICPDCNERTYLYAWNVLR